MITGGIGIKENFMLKFGNTYLKFGNDFIHDVKETLLPNTVRLKYKEGVIPTFSKGEAKQESVSPNVWRLTYNNNNWRRLLYQHYDLTDVLEGNTSNVTSMESMCQWCTSLTSVNLFDTSNSRNTSWMFSECSSLNSVPYFNTRLVTNMNGMFHQAQNLRSVPEFDCSNVTSTTSMFYNCKRLSDVSLSNTTKLENMSDMFIFSNVKNVNLVTSSVTNMWDLFYQDMAISSMPNFDTRNVSAMSYMFFDCKNLKRINLIDTSNVKLMAFSFYGCNNVSSGALALYQQASTQANPPTNHLHTFMGCGVSSQTGSAELAQIPDDWK